MKRARNKKGQFTKAAKRKPARKPRAAARRTASNRTKPRARRKTVARKMPARYTSGPKKGQFKKAGGTTTRRRRRTSARAPAGRRSYRRNPPLGKGLVKNLTDGAIGAGWVLTGKAIVKAIPQQLNLPEQGMMGYAVQGAIAIVAAQLVRGVVGAKAANMILIGGFTAPVEQAIVAANVPILSPALSAYPQLSMSAYPSLSTDPGMLELAAYPSAMSDVEGYGAGGY